METERTSFKGSLLETFLYFGLVFVLLNGTTFMYTLIMGDPRLLVFNYSWIIQIGIPFVSSIIYTLINRNGVLKITDYNDLTPITTQIESLIFRNGYIRIDTNTDYIKYGKKTMWGRFFNYFFREDIEVRISENKVLIFAKRNMLVRIEMKLKYNKRIK